MTRLIPRLTPKHAQFLLTRAAKIFNIAPKSRICMRKPYLLLSLLIVAAVGPIRADVIPSLSSTSPVGANFTWNYSTNVTVDQMVQPGDFFTIYDFGSFLPGSNSQPTGWSFSASLTGLNPSLVLPTDNPSLLNLTWVYNGSTPINGSALLGTFSIVTNTNQLRTSDFAAEATRVSGPNAGTKIDNVGTISVPVPEVPALFPVLGLCGALIASRIPSYLRRRKTA